MDPITSYDTIKKALSGWGYDAEEISLINRRVMQLVFKHFAKAFISFDYNETQESLWLTVKTSSSNFSAELYYVLNKIDKGYQFPSTYIMTREAKIFYSVFSISSKRLGDIGTIFFSRPHELNFANSKKELEALRLMDKQRQRLPRPPQGLRRQNSITALHIPAHGGIGDVADTTHASSDSSAPRCGGLDELRRQAQQKARLKPVLGETEEEFEKRVEVLMEGLREKQAQFQTKYAEKRYELLKAFGKPHKETFI